MLQKSDGTIVFGNRMRPLEEKVMGRPTMRRMRSNVLGGIAVENVGDAKVVLEEMTAQGVSGCCVAVSLRPTPEAQAEGREYFKG